MYCVIGSYIDVWDFQKIHVAIKYSLKKTCLYCKCPMKYKKLSNTKSGKTYMHGVSSSLQSPR